MIIMDDATKHIAALHWSFSDSLCDWNRAALLNALVWSRFIVVTYIFANNYSQVSFTYDQQAIQALFSYTANPSFGEPIRLRRSIGRADDLDAFSQEHCVETSRKFRVAISDQENDRSLLILQ